MCLGNADGSAENDDEKLKKLFGLLRKPVKLFFSKIISESRCRVFDLAVFFLYYGYTCLLLWNAERAVVFFCWSKVRNFFDLLSIAARMLAAATTRLIVLRVIRAEEKN